MAFSPKSFALGFLTAMASMPAAAAEDITVWSAVAYVMYGERTPLVGPTNPSLTPLGAQQMFSQGSTFRNRYILEGLGNESTDALLPVYGLERNALDTTQITSMSTDDSYVVAGAQAFLQGLYPPQENQFAYENGGSAASVLATGAFVNSPLDGYQYPLVHTASFEDPTSSWLEGNVECTAYQESAIEFREDDKTGAHLYTSSFSFYQQMWPVVFEGVFSAAMTNFYYAYQLYDYAAYQYEHNADIASTLNSSELTLLKVFADSQQLDLNANLSVSGKQSGDMIRAISGRMLAQEVVTLMRQNILQGGANNKLALMFGSFEPFLAFFALSGLLGGDSAGTFESMPGNGGAMVFELYSLTANDDTVGNDTVYPSPDELHVRFLYRPNTDADSELAQYGLFTNNTSTELNMTYTAFASAMEAIGVESVAAWCSMCDAVSVFCPGLMENAGYGDGSGSDSGSSGSSDGGSSRKKTGMVPAVAGVIGALVTLSVIGIAVGTAMLLGGLRFFFAGRGRSESVGNASKSDNKTDIFSKRFSFGNGGGFSGGFKGGERKLADADMVVSDSGMGHERIGSWELRNSGAPAIGSTGAVGTAGATSSDAMPRQPERVRSTILNRTPDDDDDDIMADLGRSPVDPREHI